jgi:hypothetical protein
MLEIPFTINIQTPLMQLAWMLEFGHNEIILHVFSTNVQR